MKKSTSEEKNYTLRGSVAEAELDANTPKVVLEIQGHRRLHLLLCRLHLARNYLGSLNENRNRALSDFTVLMF